MSPEISETTLRGPEIIGFKCFGPEIPGFRVLGQEVVGFTTFGLEIVGFTVLGLDIFGFRIKEWYFAIFNIADSAISIAAFLIILDFIFVKKDEQMKDEPKQDLSESI